MKTPRIANAMGHIDDELVSGANRVKTAKKSSWLKWGSVAACLAVLVIAGAAFIPSFFGNNTSPNITNSRYKVFNIQENHSEIIWPWEYKTVYEKYTELSLDGTEYRCKGRAISENLVGELIGTHTVVGYDEITDEKHTSDFEVYQLNYADKNQFVAVKMDEAYYVFKNNEYAPPSTLGKLFDMVDFSKAVRLNRFSENGDSPSAKHYALNSDNYVWEVLAACKNAAFIEDDQWTTESREYISFTITSETLGVYKAAMYITADGYLWTNTFDWQYLFNIGDEAAGKIIKYVKENSVEVPYEPYQNSIVGEIVEITENYILVDDAMLCIDPANGITYKVLFNDVRLSRYVDNNVIRVGDTVQIYYEEDSNENNSSTISSAVSISKAIISDGIADILE